MSMYGGVNMMLGKGGAAKGNKSAPRPGAAKGQGAGMGGCNSSAVGKAMGSVKGYDTKPQYYSGAGSGRGNK